MARREPVEDALVRNDHGHIMGKSIVHGRSNAPARRRAGDHQAVHVHLAQVVQQGRPEECTGPGFVNHEIARVRCKLGEKLLRLDASGR